LPIDALRLPWADSTYTVKLAKPGIGNVDIGREAIIWRGSEPGEFDASWS
jgi:hypothetical protein